MMLKVKNITMKNFMSIGSVTKGVNLDENALTLILGDNIDQGSEGSRNGVGKSVIVDALSYALYGQPLRKISLPNLVNKHNNKNMFVTIDFEKDDVSYRIERGKKPDIFRFLINDVDVEDDKAIDEAQGEKKDSQAEIVKIFGMSHMLFKHILALYSKTIPFIDEGAPSQRKIIEELLGITELSEKAEILSGNMKDTKTEIGREEFRHKLIIDTNLKTQKTIDQLTIKSNGWDKDHAKTLVKLEVTLEKMLEMNIVEEINNHKKQEQQQISIREENDKIRNIQLAYDEITRNEQSKYNDFQYEHTKIETSIKSSQNTLDMVSVQTQTITDNYKQLIEHTCPACGQEVHDDNHDKMLATCESDLEKLVTKQNDCEAEIKANNILLMEKETEMKKQHHVLDEVLSAPPADVDIPKREAIETIYDDIREAYEHKTNLDNLIAMFEKETIGGNPFIDQIKTISDNIQEINYDIMNELVDLLNHQDFLLKLLTKKDSNIRIQIIEQNISFLNSRLNHYCDELGLPHTVHFGSDLNVDIVKTGNSYDSGNLSGGESTRLVLAFSFAFRDMHEALNYPINLMFVDELIDSGMDAKGAEMALHILKDNARNNNKNIFLISHRDDFIPRVSNVLMVTYENNFTDYAFELDVEV